MIAEDDVAAARRLLSIFAESGERQSREDVTRNRIKLVEGAQAALALRRERIRLLGPEFGHEQGFALLLGLYIHDVRAMKLTATTLANVASVHMTSSLRWLEQLVAGGWIGREKDQHDARKVFYSLTDKGRTVLNELLGSVVALEGELGPAES